MLVLYWDEKDFPANVEFERNFQAAVRSASRDTVEFYAEFLESTRFPGKDQETFLRDYIRRKYANLPMDVVVPAANKPLEFLFKYRSDLFPQTPVVFSSASSPDEKELKSGAGATGVLLLSSYKRTLDLALGLHPGTKQVFVISGTPEHDKLYELKARSQLRSYESKVVITYLTDLTLPELTERVKTLPDRSIVLYVWQMARNNQGKLLQSREVLQMLASLSPVPFYGMTHANVGYGIVGGYVWTMEAHTDRLAEITLKVASGTPAASIPVESAPETPMFDWRELQRWGIPEDSLPANSVIRFRELSLWQQFKWRILAAIAIFVLQSLLIGALLVARRRARRTRLELEKYKESLEQLVEKRTADLVEARDQALAANRSKSMFLAHMSHELRTPLNAILGYSGMVLRRSSLSDQDRADLAIVGRSGEHLLGLIDEVLDMAKIETGRVTVESASMDLHHLVNETIAMFREGAQAKHLQLLLDISSKVPQRIRSDAGKLRQVLTNLVSNAVKCTEEGGIIVRVDCRTHADLHHRTLIFEVEDTGIGIAPEDQARIFDPFVQADSTRNTKGTGLGLNITRGFVQLLGGTIHVESNPGRGSRFRVEVPVYPAEAVETRAPDSSREQVLSLEPGQPDKRILIVEDQKENWILLQRLLEEAGFQVRVAEDGTQAVEAFRVWRPHFIWMDLRLPGMDGMEAARRIRELDGGRDVKIVALTASAFASQREEVLAAGFDGFLRKPYRREEIFDYVAQQLGVRYVYSARASTDNPPPFTLRPEDLAAIPVSVRDALESAVISLNGERIMAAVSQVSEHDATLGNVLLRLAGKYQYTSILDTLQRCKKSSTEANA